MNGSTEKNKHIRAPIKEEVIILNKVKKKIYGSSAIIALISTQAAIKFIGIDNISTQVIVAFLTIICVLFIGIQYKNRTKGFGVKYNITVAILMTLICLFAGLTIIIFKEYPDLINKYGGFILLLGVSNFVGLALFMAIYRIVYESKRK